MNDIGQFGIVELGLGERYAVLLLEDRIHRLLLPFCRRTCCMIWYWRDTLELTMIMVQRRQ